MKTEEKQNCFLSASICVHLRLSHLIFLILPIIFVIGCSEAKDATPESCAQRSEHHAPHGRSGSRIGRGGISSGVAYVTLSPGKLQAYVLDGEMENFVRISAESFDLTIQLAGKETTLVMKAVANRATGETVGDIRPCSQAQANWLATTPSFDGLLKEIVVQGKTYFNVKFHFPEANGRKAKVAVEA